MWPTSRIAYIARLLRCSPCDSASRDFEDTDAAGDGETEEVILPHSNGDSSRARRPHRIRRSPGRYGEHANPHNVDTTGGVISIPIITSDTPI